MSTSSTITEELYPRNHQIKRNIILLQTPIQRKTDSSPPIFGKTLTHGNFGKFLEISARCKNILLQSIYL